MPGTALPRLRLRPAGKSGEIRGTQEYAQRARGLDRQYNNTPAGQAGKVQRRLEEFGKVLFPVAGQFHEISRDFHDLIKFATEDIAKTRFQTDPDHDAPSQVPHSSLVPSPGT